MAQQLKWWVRKPKTAEVKVEKAEPKTQKPEPEPSSSTAKAGVTVSTDKASK